MLATWKLAKVQFFEPKKGKGRGSLVVRGPLPEWINELFATVERCTLEKFLLHQPERSHLVPGIAKQDIANAQKKLIQVKPKENPKPGEDENWPANLSLKVPTTTSNGIEAGIIKDRAGTGLMRLDELPEGKLADRVGVDFLTFYKSSAGKWGYSGPQVDHADSDIMQCAEGSSESADFRGNERARSWAVRGPICESRVRSPGGGCWRQCAVPTVLPTAAAIPIPAAAATATATMGRTVAGPVFGSATGLSTLSWSTATTATPSPATWPTTCPGSGFPCSTALPWSVSCTPPTAAAMPQQQPLQQPQPEPLHHRSLTKHDRYRWMTNQKPKKRSWTMFRPLRTRESISLLLIDLN